MTTALVIHGHFYQPPRENPWTEMIDREASARPFHDWNERIHRECYRPNAYARIFDAYGRIERIVNNYANISFNFGPTLLCWLERQHPATYWRIVEADRASVATRGGHGNAIAQGYHHVILPLCNARDQRTQVRWGVGDFRRRFGREPESLWLPETACNDETLGVLIEEGLKYVILSPHQAERVRPIGASAWQSVIDGGVNPSVPYKYFHRDGSGRSIAVFFYDGMISKSIAFDGLLASSRMLIDRCERAASGGAPLVHIATDGESYGHHFHFGDRCLAYALEAEAAAHGFRVTNYGEFLAENPPTLEAEIKQGPEGEGTAWSCAHGVGRWTRDCSCHAGAQEGWNQKWRTPLRAALDFLRDDAASKFEDAGDGLLRDPWAARDDYVELLVHPTKTAREEFLRRHGAGDLDAAKQTRALTLLELQRHAMVMYTSCGWFFNDISGLETVQVLRYAGRALELLDELNLGAPRDEFLEILAGAESNVRGVGNGADIFRRAVERSRVTPPRVAAHIAISNFLDHTDDNDPSGEAAGYTYQTRNFRKLRQGRLMLATAQLSLDSNATGRPYSYALAAMHFGDVDYYCALKPSAGEGLEEATEKLWTQFRRASLPVMLRLAQQLFGPDEYGIEHLLPQGRQRLSEAVFGSMVERYTEQYEFLYEENRRVIEVLQEAGFELPAELRAAAEFTVARRFERELREQLAGEGPGDYSKAFELADEAARLGYRIKRPAIDHLFEETVTRLVGFTALHPSLASFQSALMLIALAKRLNLEANLERAQEAIYEALRGGAPASGEMRKLALVLGLSPRIAPPGARPSLGTADLPSIEAILSEATGGQGEAQPV
jgi:alpha-amylase/alpha-mannosidase (GH57 family)